MMMNNDFREQLIADHLTARNLSGLFKPLINLKGYTLNQRYTLRWLFAVGGQSVLYQAENENKQSFIVKMAFLPYHRPAYISTQDIQQARNRLEREARLLQDFQGTILPKFHELVYAPNPLHSKARSEEIIQHEPFLIMELVEGKTLLEIVRAIHKFQNAHADKLEALAWFIASTVTDFSIYLEKQIKPYIYSDLNLHNIILTEDSIQPLRILDAGSLVPNQTDHTLSLPFTPSYVPPEYYFAYEKGVMLWPDKKYVLYTLGKLLWEVLTNRQPYVAEDPDLTEPKLRDYSIPIQSFIADLIHGQYNSFEEIKSASKSNVPLANNNDFLEVYRIADLLFKESIPIEGIESSYDEPQQEKGIHLTKIRSWRNSDNIRKLRYSPNGRYMGIAYKHKIEIWNAHTFKVEMIFDMPDMGLIGGIDFDGTGENLAVVSDGRVYLWRIGSEKAIWQLQEKGLNDQVALNGEGDVLAAATLWGAITFQPRIMQGYRQSFDGITDKGTTIALANNSPLLAVGGLWGVRLWDIETHVELGADKFNVGTSNFVMQVGFGNRDQVLSALCIDINKENCYSILQWNLSSYELLGRIDLPTEKITDFRLASNSKLSFISSRNGYIWLWDGEKILKQIQGFGQITSLDYDAKGQTLATASSNGEVNIYILNYRGDI